MKQVIYWSDWDQSYYMTSRANYTAYVQDARKIHKLDGVTDPYEFIRNMQAYYKDNVEYIVLDKGIHDSKALWR